MIKVLNLYAGIGGNRKLWENVEVTAVEIDKDIAKIYKDFFPDDNVIIGDAHKYLLDHYKEFDFIWTSPPCPTHSDIRRLWVQKDRLPPKYPDMMLYEEIIFLNHFYKGKWVVENVRSYYKPLIKPYICDRHFLWSNFIITDKEVQEKVIIKDDNILQLQKILNIDISKYHNVEKRNLLRNCVNPKLALHIFNLAFKEPQTTLI